MASGGRGDEGFSRAVPARGSELGVSLIELLVVVVLTGVVLSVLGSAVIQSQRTVARTFERQDDIGQARLAVTAASADLRTLVRLQNTAENVIFVRAGAQDVEFYANRDLPADRRPTRVRLRVNAGGDLVREAVRPTGTSTTARSSDYTGPPTTRVLARGLRPGSALRYYARYPATSPGDLLALDASGQLPSSSHSSVRFIGLHVEVERNGTRSIGPTGVGQVVYLPNLRPLDQR